MGKIKKILSLALAVLTVAGSTAAISAKPFDDVNSDNSYEEQIDILSDIGVIVGTSENEFSPDEKVTREQMALLLFRLMLNKPSGGTVNTSPFKDLYNDTYHGAISWAAASGYILGTEAEKFDPTAGITLQDAMTILVRALGQSTPQMNAGYPWTYIDAGIKLGLDENLTHISYDETLTRAETAAILYNALLGEYLIPKIVAGQTVYEKTTIIEEVFGYEISEATLAATNTLSLTGSTVVKNGYVQLVTENGSIAVKFDELGLDGTADDYLGHQLKVIYDADNSTKLINVLGAVELGKTETYKKAELASDDSYVTIGGVKYDIVEERSEAIATNKNELIVFAYDNTDGTLTQITTNEDFAERLGFYEIELLFAHESDTEASLALVKNYTLGKLDVNADGNINLADNKKAEDLTGGIINKAEAKDGDYVLYHYNSGLKRLELAEILEPAVGVITRLTASAAKFDGNTYALGNEAAGIPASAISSALTVGEKSKVLIYDNAIVGVVDSHVQGLDSEYLVVTKDASTVYVDGVFRIVATVNIDGEYKNVYVSKADAKAGDVYRYVVTGDVYTLIAPELEDGTIKSGLNQFVQNANGIYEIAAIIDEANGASIAISGTNYVLDKGESEASTSASSFRNFKFVTDANTVIAVATEDGIVYKNGFYNSSISINDGAKVVAVFRNEAGSVETLKYLYISDGSLGEYDSSAQAVKILGVNGLVYENNTTYTEYLVFNFSTGKTEEKLSAYSTLEAGKVYLTSPNGEIVNSEFEGILSGFVNGFTSSTITVGEETYKLAADVKVVKHDANNKEIAMTVSDVYMTNIEFHVVSGVVKSIIAGAAPVIEAEFDAEGETVTISADFDITAFDSATLRLTGIKLNNTALTASDYSIAVSEGAIVLTKDEGTFEDGIYTILFNLGGKGFTVNCEVEHPADSE